MHALQRQGLAIATAMATAIALASGVAGAATNPAGLVGSHWQLIQFRSNDDNQPPLKPTGPGPGLYTLSLLSGGRVQLQLDCNQAQGSWTALSSRDRANGAFAFGPLAQTRMHCPDSSLEPAITAKLPWVRSFRLEGSNLYLGLMADGGIFSWQRLDGGNGPKLWRVRQLDQPLPLRLVASPRGLVLRELSAGMVLQNLGCSTADQSWCQVQNPGGGPRGYVPLRDLESEPSAPPR